MIKKSEKLYKGRAGQLYVMSLLLARGWNVAIPEVDTGDDIFVVKDRSGDFIKVQVKTTYTILRRNNENFKVNFNIPEEQLLLEEEFDFIYAFVILKGLAFHSDIILIEKSVLQDKLSSLKENPTSGNINIYLEFINQKVFTQSLDLTEYLNNYSFFPLQFLIHLFQNENKAFQNGRLYFLHLFPPFGCIIL